MKPSNIFRWIVALLILGFGIISHDPKTGPFWFAFAIALCAVPLLAQFARRTWIRAYGIYFGLFVLLQAVISGHFLPDSYLRHFPHMNSYTDIRGDNLHGINGVQHFTTDGHGFRTTKTINYDAKGDYRIFFIGASTVAQVYVGDKKTFPHLVQESLGAALGRNIEVVNTSVQGLRAVHNLETMKRVASFHPDMYVIVPGANDWGLHITLHFDKGNPNRFVHGVINDEPVKYGINFLVAARRYTLKHTVLGRAVNVARAMVRSIVSGPPQGFGDNPERKVDYAELYKRERGSLYRKDRRTFMPKSVRPDYAKTMKEIVAFCKKSPARCVFVTHPQSFKPGTTKAYRDRFWMTPAFEKYTLTFASMAHVAGTYNRYLRELGKQSGVPVCDLEAQIAPTLDNFYDEIHFNIEGSRKAAAALHNCLLEVIRSRQKSK